MGLLNKAYDLYYRLIFTKVTCPFNSRDNLFQLTFDENWEYSRKGNSFYSFHNRKDNLKGGLQLSLTWHVKPPKEMNEKEVVLNIINTEENASVEVETVSLSNCNAYHFSRKYNDSNMIFYYWYIYKKEILMIITFMIFEDETDSVKNNWLTRVVGILNSLNLDIDRFQKTRMR
ncbi:MAG TPA: hypothetical protein VGD40_19190 [Chryseosolibacter sp.]